MKSKTRIIILTLNILMSAAIITLTALCLGGWSVLVRTVCYFFGSAGLVFVTVFCALKKDALFKSGFVLVCCALIAVLAIALISVFADLGSYGSDADRIERLTGMIRSSGSRGMAVYVVIQILQVVVLPLPAVVCYVPGSRIWGAWTATLLASAGVIIGSLIAYFLGRVFGKRAAIWIAGRENTEKYSAYIAGRGKVIFVLMQILPFFPDDILCLVAGLTSMNLGFFTAVMVIIRPLVIAVYCFLGSGTIIPFSGWGIPVWIAVFAICIVLAVLSFKYQDKFERWLVSLFRRGGADKGEHGAQSEEENGENG